MTTTVEQPRSGSATLGQRGPAEHQRRQQILKAADEHFRHYGYSKTTVADLAKSIQLSTAYIYKFFESKQAIGEAICADALGAVAAELRQMVRENKPAARRLRQIYKTLARRGTELFFSERKLHDLAVIACTERWQAVKDHQAALLEIIRDLIARGRETGEFERKTPIAETSLAVLQTMELFSQPLFFEQNFDDAEERALSIANLVLRSLAP